MQFAFSQIIDRFSNALGVSKFEIAETFNKPDKSSILGGTTISLKNFGNSYVLITFGIDGQIVRFENAFKIYPQLLDKEIRKMKAEEVMFEFMEKFGIEKDIPGIGKKKIFADPQRKAFFQGILDIDKYSNAVKQLNGQS